MQGGSLHLQVLHLQVLNLLLLHTLLPGRHFLEITVYSHEIKNFREELERAENRRPTFSGL